MEGFLTPRAVAATVDQAEKQAALSHYRWLVFLCQRIRLPSDIYCLLFLYLILWQQQHA